MGAMLAHEGDELACLALNRVDRLPVASAQLQDRALVGDLERTPGGPIVPPRSGSSIAFDGRSLIERPSTDDHRIGGHG